MHIGGNTEELIRQLPNMRIKTFTHDYYMLELPASLDAQFYKQFPDYAQKLDFRNNHISMAPVARIYGTNEFGQKCCSHIHGFFPFFYVKTDEYTDAFKNDEGFMKKFLELLQNLFQKAYSIFEPILVGGQIEQKLDFYGYHEKSETFLKITVYNPVHIYRLRQLLDSNILNGKSFQCYQAHINYYMQLFTEFNIFGIHEMKVEGFTFRKNLDESTMQLFCKVDPQINGRIMQSGWNIIQEEKTNPHLFNSLHKVSTCYLEFDVPVQSILNSYALEFQEEEMNSFDSSNSQKLSQPMSKHHQFFKVKITKALEQIWLDQRRRRINQSISEPLVGIIDYTHNLQGNDDVINMKKDPLWINFINKGNGRIMEQLVAMIISASKARERQPIYQVKQSRNIVENYDGVLYQQRQELIQKVKSRWKYYGERKVNLLRQIMAGEKGELPEWDEDSSEGSQEKEREERIQMGNTLLYRNNYKHIKNSLKKKSYFELCEYCRKKSQNCFCAEEIESQNVPTLKKVFQSHIKQKECSQLVYKKPPPSALEAIQTNNIMHQKPYYSNIKDLFSYHKINTLFKPTLKNAQILTRQLKYLKQYHRQPITIKNENKLPQFYEIFQRPQTDKIKKYEPTPPPYFHNDQSQMDEELLFRKSVSMAKEETFVSDLIILQYQFISQMEEDHCFMANPQTHPVVCFIFQLVNFKDYLHNIKGMIIVERYAPQNRNYNISYNNFKDEFDDILVVKNEEGLFFLLILLIFKVDPDIFVTYDQQKRGIRYLSQRGFQMGINLPSMISRTCQLQDLFQFLNFRDFYFLKQTYIPKEILTKGNVLQTNSPQKHKSQLKFLERKMRERINKKPVLRKKYRFDVDIKGRVNLNLQRICEQDSKQRCYTIEAVNKYLFNEQICEFTDFQIFKLLKNESNLQWVSQYINKRIKIQSKIIIRLNIVSGIIEKSKIYGADFVSMMQRGSQFKIQSVLCRVTKRCDYVTLSASKRQVANQSVLQCRPLVIQPPKQFFSEPVILFDFQSLYPSVMIAYNLCYSTCLGSITTLFNKVKTKKLGVSQNMTLTTEWLQQIIKNYSEEQAKRLLQQYIFITPNKVAFVKKSIRQGLIPNILQQFLISRMMIKKSIHLYSKNQIKAMLKEREVSLKLFMNVTFGYTGASFTGRMPCSEIADSVVQISKYCLKQCIDFLNEHKKYKGHVIYGDTDSMFFHVPDLSIKEAIRAGKQLQQQMTKLFPYPMKMKFQKAYDGLFLVAKKRYYGKFYEDQNQLPKYEGKGLECVRRDGISLTSKVMKQLLNQLIQKRDLSVIKKLFRSHYSNLIGGFKHENQIYLAKEVKMIKYTEKSCPAHGQAAKRLQKIDPMLMPKYGQRMKYLVIKSSLKPLRNRSISVFQYLMKNMNIDWEYYAEKQFVPPLQRVFSSLVSLKEWCPTQFAYDYQHINQMNVFLKKKCLKCKETSKLILCENCFENATIEKERVRKLKQEAQEVCRKCVDNKYVDVGKCIEWNCPQFSKRLKSERIQKATHSELEKIESALKSLQF